MSRLSDVDIEFFRRTGHLDITPYDDDALQGASYDLHLDGLVSTPVQCENTGDIFWLTDEFDEDCRGNLTYTIPPHGFRLFSTVEEVWVGPNLSAVVAGKSSRAREGIEVEIAGFVDPGFRGQITLEVSNKLPFEITVQAGMPIAQIVFDELRTPTQRPYHLKGHYYGQKGPTTSWLS